MCKVGFCGTLQIKVCIPMVKADIKPQGQRVLRRVGGILQYRPVASNKTAVGRAGNGRIEIILIDRDLDMAKKMRQYL